MKTNNPKSKLLLLILPLLLLGLLALGGCDSDAVAPNDDNPTLTEEDAAYQSSIIALALVEVGPQLIRPDPVKTIYTHTFDGADGVTGTVEMDFRLGGADGVSASSGTADWGHLYTTDPTGLMFESSLGGRMFVVLDIMGDINQTAGTVTITAGSGGGLTAGVYAATFDIDGLVIAGNGSYPSAGTIGFSSAGHHLTLTFNGTVNVPISIHDVVTWVLNLETGALTDATINRS